MQRKSEALQGEKAKHAEALSNAAALLRQVGDLASARELEHRAHVMLKAASSVGDSTRLFVAAKRVQREHERREREEAQREDARRRELDAAFRLAKEETAAKRAAACEAREETRRKLAAIDVERRANKERAERRKANLAYIQQHLAADLVACARAFLQRGAHGEERAAALRARAKKYSGSTKWLAASRKVVDPAWDGNMVSGTSWSRPVSVWRKGKVQA